MKPFNKKISTLSVLAIVSLAMISSATAITSSDVSATIEQPTEDEEVTTGMFTDEVDYDVALDNNFENDSTVDIKLTFTDEDGNSYESWYNDTRVDGNTEEEVRLEDTPDGYTPPEDSYADVSADVDATFYEVDNESDSATVSDSLAFKLKQNTTFGALMALFVILALVGSFKMS